jgi:hypothetical protein
MILLRLRRDVVAVTLNGRFFQTRLFPIELLIKFSPSETASKSVKPLQNLAFTALAFFRGIAYKIFLSYSVSFQKNLLKPISRLLPELRGFF